MAGTEQEVQLKTKKIKVDGQTEKVEFRNKGGAGYKGCDSCSGDNAEFKYVAAQTARKIKKCHCGTDFAFKAKQTKNQFIGLKQTDYELILRLADEVRTGTNLTRPEDDRPTVGDYRDAGNDLEKIAELNIALSQWEVYDAASVMPKKQKEHLKAAAKAVYKD